MLTSCLAHQSFAPKDVTSEAKAIAADFRGTGGAPTDGSDAPFGKLVPRFPVEIYPLSGGGHRDIKIVARTKNVISFGDQDIDLAAVEQVNPLAFRVSGCHLFRSFVESKLSGLGSLVQWLNLSKQIGFPILASEKGLRAARFGRCAVRRLQ